MKFSLEQIERLRDRIILFCSIVTGLIGFLTGWIAWHK